MLSRGIYPIVPTPFDDAGQIDVQSIERLVEFLAVRGVCGAAILGVMGEAHKLREPEQDAVVRSFRACLPPSLALVVGVRAAGTDVAVAMARSASAHQPDALLVGPPPVQDDDVLLSYYRRIAGATDVPLIVHDYPEATGIRMSPQLIARLYREIDAVRYIKLEDPPTGPKIDRVSELTGGDIGVFGALGGTFAFEELDRGAMGIMTGFAYPELLVEMFRRYEAGDVDGCTRVFHDALPLIRFEFQRGLGVSLRKEILVRRGVFATARVRHPGAMADAKTLQHLDRLVRQLEAKGYDAAMRRQE